jgi:predicted  nucleic acid-binding Zn-ribbon protein
MPDDGVIARLARIEANMATRADLQTALAGVATNVEIAAFGRLLAQQRDGIAGLKDDMSVLTAIVQRLDNSHTRLLSEIRATHAQVSRLAERVGRTDEWISQLEGEPQNRQ